MADLTTPGNGGEVWPGAGNGWAERLCGLSGDLLCVAGFDGYIKAVNPAFTALTGYSAAELMAVPYLDFVHPDDRAAAASTAERLGSGQASLPLKNRYRHRDGSYRSLEWVMASDPEHAVLFGSGRDVSAAEERAAEYVRATVANVQERATSAAQVALVADASARERARHQEEEAEESAHYRDLFSHLPVGVFRATPAGGLLEVNPAMMQMFGYTDFETFRAAANLFARLERRDTDAGNATAAHQVMESHGRRADGSAIVVRVDLSVRHGDSDDAVVEGTVLDITAKRRAESATELRLAVQAVLLHIAQETLKGTPVDELLRVALRMASDVIGARWAAMCDLREGSLYPRVSYNLWSELASGAPLPPDTFSARVAMAEAPISVIDWETDTGHISERPVEQLDICSSLGTAIRGRDGVIGTVVFHSDERDHWNEQHVGFVELFGSMLWICMERARDHGDLIRTNDERKRLLTSLVHAQEEERRRIAADIHDDAVQVMSAVNLRLHMLRRSLTSEADLAMATGLEQTVRLSIVRLRTLLYELSPPALDTYGLASALQMHLHDYEAEGVCECRITGDLEEQALGGNARVIIYRIALEALANVRKHAAASLVTVELLARDGGCLTRIVDNGRGMPIQPHPTVGRGHLGLTSMRERAELAGGWWRIEGKPDAGTTVEFWVPDDEDAA